MLLTKFQQSKLYYCLCHKFTAKLPVIWSTTIGCWCTYFANVTLAFNVNGFVPVCCMRNSNDSLYCYYYTISPSRNEKKTSPVKSYYSLFILTACFLWFLDDSMTILMAFGEPSVEIIGLTTIFGNVTTEYATRNALLLVSGGHCWVLLLPILAFANRFESSKDSVREQGILRFQ